jgi:hypothetical protein
MSKKENKSSNKNDELKIESLAKINDFQDNIKSNSTLKEILKFLSRTEIAKHCYQLVGYDRKVEINDLFEKLVSRAIRLAILIVDYPSQFSVDENTHDVFVMSKVLEPKIDVKIKGSKATKKVLNKDESLLPVSTYIVDKMYKQKYPTGTRKTQTKDEKTISNFKNITKDFLVGMKKLIEYSSKQNVKFFDMVDDTTFESLEEIKDFLNSEDYSNIRAFSVEYQVDFNGKLEKAIN